jgi:hypothetical protein
MDFTRCAVAVPTEAEVHSQLRRYFKVILNERVIIMIVIVPIGIGLRARPRINRCLLEIGVVTGEIGVGLVLDVFIAAMTAGSNALMDPS